MPVDLNTIAISNMWLIILYELSLHITNFLLKMPTLSHSHSSLPSSLEATILIRQSELMDRGAKYVLVGEGRRVCCTVACRLQIGNLSDNGFL